MHSKFAFRLIRLQRGVLGRAHCLSDRGIGQQWNRRAWAIQLLSIVHAEGVVCSIDERDDLSWHDNNGNLWLLEQ